MVTEGVGATVGCRAVTAWGMHPGCGSLSAPGSAQQRAATSSNDAHHLHPLQSQCYEGASGRATYRVGLEQNGVHPPRKAAARCREALILARNPQERTLVASSTSSRPVAVSRTSNDWRSALGHPSVTSALTFLQKYSSIHRSPSTIIGESVFTVGTHLLGQSEAQKEIVPVHAEYAWDRWSGRCRSHRTLFKRTASDPIEWCRILFFPASTATALAVTAAVTATNSYGEEGDNEGGVSNAANAHH